MQASHGVISFHYLSASVWVTTGMKLSFVALKFVCNTRVEATGRADGTLLAGG
jgi:hypothetical protein